MNVEEETKQSRKHFWLIGIVVVVVLSCSALFIAFAYAFIETNNAVEDTIQPLVRGEKSERRDEVLDLTKDHFSVLLLGLDNRENNDTGRTDTLIVATFNKETNQVSLVSIPRDSYVAINNDGNRFFDKINHAYSYGGVDLTIETVENLFDIPIDYYATINFKGVRDLVDALGGIEVDVLIPVSGSETGNVNLKPGVQTLNGKEALAYVRMRKQDPEGDIGRTKRQQQVVESIVSAAADIDSLGQIADILGTIRKNVRTNMTLMEATQLQPYAESLRDFDQYTLKGGDSKINGIYYYQLDEVDLEAKRELLKRELGLIKRQVKQK